MPHNPYRGEVEAHLNGKPHRLRLTLGALAELEAALQAQDLLSLLQRFEEGRFTTRELIAIITAGLRGAGHETSEQEVARMSHAHGVRGFVDLAARLLSAAFPAPEDEPPGPDAA